MYIKEALKLKRKLNKICSSVIDNLIEQLMANEQAMIAHSGDASQQLTADSLKYSLTINVIDNKTKIPFEINGNNKVDLK